jgi:pyruvate dehydrogenase E1 component beta subunit
VVHQAVERCGVGAEIATVVSERRWGDLAAPVRRVAARNTPVPYAAELESAHLPSVDDIAGALLATVA